MLQKQLNKLAYQSKDQRTSLLLFRYLAILITTAETAHRFLRHTSNVMSTSPLLNEEEKANSVTDMLILRETINDSRESVASCAQSSNTSLSNEDILIREALALPSALEINPSNQDFNILTDADSLDGETSDALISSGKRISIALNSTNPLINLKSELQSIDDKITTEKFSEIDIVESCVVRTPIIIDTIKQTSTKKQHIMISYNRSCENTCRQIRNQLKVLKYKVWMDVYDMHDNFIDGMANAIRNSYIVLMCINREYYNSFWCKKEAEDIAIQGIKFIPCFMEEPFPLRDWLGFLVGANVWIDFSKEDKFHESFEKLIQEITFIEETLATNPRETAPIVTIDAITTNSTIATFETTLGNFKFWIEANRHSLKQLDQKQSAKLISQLTEVLQNENSISDDQNKQEFLQQLLLSTSKYLNEKFTRLISNSIASKYPMIKGLICIMALWAVRVVFQNN